MPWSVGPGHGSPLDIWDSTRQSLWRKPKVVGRAEFGEIHAKSLYLGIWKAVEVLFSEEKTKSFKTGRRSKVYSLIATGAPHATGRLQNLPLLSWGNEIMRRPDLSCKSLTYSRPSASWVYWKIFSDLICNAWLLPHLYCISRQEKDWARWRNAYSSKHGKHETQRASEEEPWVGRKTPTGTLEEIGDCNCWLT